MTSLQTVLRLQGYRKTALVSYPHTPAGCCRSRSQNDSSRCRWRRDSNIVRSYKFQNQTSRTHLHLRREEKKTHTFEKKKPNSTWSQALHLYITLWSQFVWRSSDYELQYLYFIHLLPLNPFQGCCGSCSWSQQSPAEGGIHCGRFKSACGDRRPFILQFYSEWQIYLILYVFVL